MIKPNKIKSFFLSMRILTQKLQVLTEAIRKCSDTITSFQKAIDKDRG